MMITEVWRWRLLTIWVIVFTILCSYAFFKVRAVADENRSSLCSVHLTNITTEHALRQLMEGAGMDVAKIDLQIESENIALSELECDQP